MIARVFAETGTTLPIMISGTITDGAGALNLVKQGSGRTVLSGANGYDGTTTVAAGMALQITFGVLVVASVGLSLPNTPALALTRHGEAAGTAAAMLGAVQFGVGALVAPLVGLFGSTTPVPMGLVMVVVTVLASVLMFGVVRRDPSVGLD